MQHTRIDPELPEVLTPEELAQYLRVSPSTIYRLLKAHKLPVFHVDRYPRFYRDQIEAWIHARQQAAKEEATRRRKES